jgi:hypothetical protein
MPHVVVVAGSHTVLRDVVDVGRNDRSRLRCLPLQGGDLVVFVPVGSRIDGRLAIGGVAVVEWATQAVVRTHDLRAELRWQHARDPGPAAADSCCAVCFGRIHAGERIVTCYCRTPLHDECFALLVTCPRCGEAA